MHRDANRLPLLSPFTQHTTAATATRTGALRGAHFLSVSRHGRWHVTLTVDVTGLLLSVVAMVDSWAVTRHYQDVRHHHTLLPCPCPTPTYPHHHTPPHPACLHFHHTHTLLPAHYRPPLYTCTHYRTPRTLPTAHITDLVTQRRTARACRTYAASRVTLRLPCPFSAGSGGGRFGSGRINGSACLTLAAGTLRQ